MIEQTRQQYQRFGTVEAAGSSPAYERLAAAVAADEAVLALLESAPPDARSPTLLFGALRWRGVDVADAPAALSWAREHPDDLLHVLRTRRTQTNEVARCATLLPALAELAERERRPLALVEVGASAGLALLYERWAYRWTGTGVDTRVSPPGAALTLTCAVSGDVPLPAAVPAIGWRAGLDLDPVDVRDPDARRWLSCLVWPEHTDRAERLVAALDAAAADRPRVVRGDLVDDLPALLDQVPPGCTPVVLHSAALVYVAPDRRAAFVDLLARRGVHRLGAEGAEVLPAVAALLPTGTYTDHRFVVSLDDRPLALAHPHGRSLAGL